MKMNDASGRVKSTSTKDCRPMMSDTANASNGNMVGHGGPTTYPGKGGNSFPKPPAGANVTEGDHVGPAGGNDKYASKVSASTFPKPPAGANVSKGDHIGPSNAKHYPK